MSAEPHISYAFRLLLSLDFKFVNNFEENPKNYFNTIRILPSVVIDLLSVVRDVSPGART